MQNAIEFMNNALYVAFSGGAVVAIIYTLIIMAFAAFIAIYFESYIFRAIGLLVVGFITYYFVPFVGVGVALVGLSPWQTGPVTFYISGLGFEFFGAFLVLILFESELTQYSRTFTPLAICTMILTGIAITGALPYLNHETSVEIATMLVGTFLVTMLLKREWWWDTRARYSTTAQMDKEMIKMAESGFADHLEQADAQLKIVGYSIANVDMKIHRLKSTMKILGKSGYIEDDAAGTVTIYVAAQYRTENKQRKLATEQVALSVRGGVAQARTMAKRLANHLHIQDQREGSSPFKGELQLDIIATMPEDSVGDRIFLHFRDLAVTWRNTAQEMKAQVGITPDPRKQAYLEGVARTHQQVSSQLVKALDEFQD